jgi:hypothetical protein
MYTQYERSFNLPEELGGFPVDFKESSRGDGVLELLPETRNLNAAELRFIAGELERREAYLKKMRNRYASFAYTEKMSSAEGKEMLSHFEEAELDPYSDDYDGMELFRRLEAEGEQLDSFVTDTGNVGSGDSEKILYHYRSKYYVTDRINLTCDEYENLDKAMSEGGFNR